MKCLRCQQENAQGYSAVSRRMGSQTIARRCLGAPPWLAAIATLLWLLNAVTALAQPLDPVVFVPGILGSRLEDERGVVWGDALASIRRFTELELRRSPQQDKLVATAILDSVGVLGPFRIGQYGGLMATLKDLGFREGETLFVFPYDWRRSNFDSAAKLKQFIDAQVPLHGRRFNIVAHSMGGLVARIYLHEHAGGARVNRLVTLGTPHLGSAESFWTFLKGMGAIKNFVAGGDFSVQRVVYSFESLYEMLPTYRKCCYVGAPNATPQEINLHDPGQWERFPEWPSQTVRSPSGREFVVRALARASELQRLVALPLPGNVRMFKFGGDLISTTTQFFLDPVSGAALDWKSFGGDGTVPLYSASAADDSDTEAAIQKHATIFNDDHVKLRLRRILTAYALPDPFAFRAITGWALAGPEQKPVPFESLDAAVNETYLASGQPGVVRVSITDKSGNLVEGVAVQGWLELGEGNRLALTFSRGAAGYVAPFVAPSAGGAYRVIVHVPGSGLFEEYIVAVPGG